MEEKKSIKISLGTAICIFIIAILICVIFGMWFFYNKIEKTSENKIKANGITLPNDELGTETNSYTTKLEEVKPKETTQNNDTKENIVIYYADEIKEEQIKRQSPRLDEQNLEKYKTEYSLYKDGKFIGKFNGSIHHIDDYDKHIVEFKDLAHEYKGNDKYGYDIAITGSYNAVPRTFKSTSNIPEKIRKEISSNYEIEGMETIDLDGDGIDENLVTYKYSSNKKGINNTPVVYSGVYLYDSNYNRIAELATYMDNMYGGEEENARISLSGVKYYDIDNDGVMEILVDVNSYAYSVVSIYKYENGKVIGDVGEQFNPRSLKI